VASPSGKAGTKTLADWLALPDDARVELIDGELVEKAAPDEPHAAAQAGTTAAIHGRFNRRSGGPNGPGGWWIRTELDILLDARIFRPDLAGWRRERVAALPRERPFPIRPDWICEIVSDSNRRTDTITKLHRYHQGGVPQYWLLDELDRTLTVHRHAAEGYVIVLRAEAADLVRAEPFDAIELRVGVLLGDDPED
jgi:Uma2 family endonuclease